MVLTPAERMLINKYQRGLPLVSHPYANMAEDLGISEDQVLEILRGLKKKGVLSRVGAVIAPNTVGVSTLAAMAVPEDRLTETAALVSARPEVNHNYEREHSLNLWFVVTAPDAQRLQKVLADIGEETGLTVLDLPLLEAYHIDLGFPI